jgi:hypothetical protein
MTIKLTPALALLISAFTFSFDASAQCTAQLICPEQIVVECGSNYLPEIIGYPAITEICPNAELTYSDMQSGDECLSVVIRTWVLSLNQEVIASCEQSIILEDTTPPGFGDLPEFLAVPCGEALPEPPACPAVDACSGVASCEGFSSQTGLPVDSCTLGISYGPGPDWSIWLPNIPSPSPWFIWENGGTMVTYFDGSAYISGIVRNEVDPTHAFEVSIWLNNERNWEEWSALGRNYKDDLNLVGDNYLDWSYYEMVGGFSRLTGIDALEGSLLLLSHFPANYYYGFQSGVGGNNHNANDGISGWFSFSGSYDGYDVSGDGDLSADKSCTAVTQNDCASNAGYTYFWRAVDGCGNESFAFQSVASVDVQAPTFVEFPEDVTLNCSELPYESPTPTAVDNCPGGVTLVGPVETIVEADCPVAYQIQYTWTALDACGNATSRSQTVNVLDDSLPYFAETPAVIELSCDPGDAELVQAFDDCSGVELSYTEEDIEGCEGSGIRTYTATDACGNTAQITVEVVVTDNETPIFTAFPADVQVTCNNIPSAESANISYSDNCPNLSFDMNESVIAGDCEYSYSIERVYALSDACGNSATSTWTITVSDTQSPLLYGVPDDATIGCGDEIPDAIVFAIDNCDPFPNVALTAVTVEGECGYQLIRTWTASDVCGNTTEITQVVTVTDMESPVFDPIQSQIALSCTDEIPAPFATATDDCSGVEVGVSELVSPGNCDGNYTIFRTYTATDGCGNSSVVEQVISISDDEAPLFLEQLPEITVNCDDFGSIPLPAVSDNCSEVSITWNDAPGEEACVSGINRTWIATDACGNSSEFNQTILIVDTTAPYFVNFPQDVTIACDDDVPANGLINYADNCSNVTLSVEEEIIPGDCPASYTIIRSYTITDACDNAASADWVITVIDNEAPVLYGVPDDVTLSCTEEAPDAVVFGFDNCDDLVDISLSAITEELECGYQFTRTWTAVDDCGNETVATQVVTFIDDTDPYLSYLPEDIYLQCGDEVPPVADVVALDECDENPTLVVTEIVEGNPDDCPYYIVRIFRAFDCNGNQTIYAQYIYFELGDNGFNGMQAERQEMMLSGLVGDPGSNDYQVGIQSGRGGRYALDLLDLNGRVIATINEGELTEGNFYLLPLEVQGLPSGIYLLRLRSAAGEDVMSIPVLR